MAGPAVRRCGVPLGDLCSMGCCSSRRIGRSEECAVAVNEPSSPGTPNPVMGSLTPKGRRVSLWRGGDDTEIMSIGKPTSACVPPGQCQFTDEWTASPLLERRVVNHNTRTFVFGCPDSERALGLST